MIGLDTNILVRYITHDHPAQTSLAIQFVSSLTPENPGFISLIVMVELAWVLETSFRFSRTELATSLEAVLRSKELLVENASLAWQALRDFRTNHGDFADYLIQRCGSLAGCAYTLTFDVKVAADGAMKLLR